VRLNSRVPVIIQWQDAAGMVFSHQVFTRTVGRYGCLAMLPANLLIDQQVTIVNTITGERSAGVVVWKGEQRTEGWETGLELAQPPMDFWGFEL